MLNIIDKLSLSLTLPSDAKKLMSLFQSKSIDKNIKISTIISQFESNSDFLSLFSKVKTNKLQKTMTHFNQKLQRFITNLTIEDNNNSDITHYIRTISRLLLLMFLTSQLQTFLDMTYNQCQDYINKITQKETDDDLVTILSQYKSTINNIRAKDQMSFSRMSTTNSQKVFDDDNRNIPTPKFTGFTTDDEEDILSLSFEEKNTISQLNIPIPIQKEEKQLIEGRVFNYKHQSTYNPVLTEPKGNSFVVESLKTVSEMFQKKLINKEQRTKLKERVLDKDKKILSFFCKRGNKDVLYNTILNYLNGL